MRMQGSMIQNLTVDDLSERIRVVYFPTIKNNHGDTVQGEETLRCIVWAKILPTTSRVNDTVPERNNIVNYRIAIRYRIDILPTDIIIWRGKRLKITEPPKDAESRHIWTIFDAQEVIGDGWTT